MNKKLVTIFAGIMAAIMVLSLLLSLLATTVHGATSGEVQDQIEDLNDQKEEVDKKLESIEKNLAANNKQLKNLVARKNGIDQQVELLNHQINLVNQTIAVQNLLIADAQEELDLAQAQYAMLNEAYAARIRVMEEQGDISYWSVIFQANSFADLLDRLTMAAEIARADQKQLQRLRELAQQVEAAKIALETTKQEMEYSKIELRQAQDAQQEKMAEAEGLMLDLIIKCGEYKLELEVGEQLQHDLMIEIAQKSELYDDLLYEEWLATSVPPTTTTAPTTVPPTTSSGSHKTNTVNGNTWYTPTSNYRVSSYFGYRTHPVTGEPQSYHYGIDMAAKEGTPIYATRDGKVRVTSYEKDGAGWYVSIDHYDGYISVYMHMTHYIVSPGQKVKAGEIIGYVGSTGRSTGPHLHFGIAYKGTYVDPLKFIKT